RSAHEILAALAGRPDASAYDLVRETWRGRDWERIVHDGLIPGTEAKKLDVAAKQPLPFAASSSEGLELAFAADPWIDEGQHAENAWLQELPKPLTTLTWDNALLLAPATAQALGVKAEDVVEIQSGPRALRAPVWILPGHPAGSATLHLGYGRTRGGRVAIGRGVNAYLLRDPEARGFARGVSIRKAGGRYPLAATQDHWTTKGREIAPAEDPHAHEAPTLYPDFHAEDEVAWGMSIDLSLCSGCSACVVACQAENNVPVVGKDQVLNSREMHWLRIDRYFEGPPENPRTLLQPMLCQHCEKAPCEVVCPTNATTHSADGLNQMVYNRCVGTRYCSNNCPYKVRRFNFLQYVDWGSPSDALRRNPEVSVRERGVMEKCTYCVQRIQRARIDAEVAGRPLPEIQTACGQACPTGAIVFGNIRDGRSAVARRKADPRDYGVLDELGTRPRTTYLRPLRNPNPELG
ncbi:MAG TPA: 4Fe-4S dicluster domain-containing protein, partial [Planctomycetota bacterium]|nr:4Fe-4S dicluster domain-containing protein [Planctomycetota bacterium]